MLTAEWKYYFSQLYLLCFHTAMKTDLSYPMAYPAAQEEYARSEFSKRISEVTLQVYALPRVFPKALNSFRDAKETAIETTA